VKTIISTILIGAVTSGCASMNDSLKLGAGLGAATGAAAAYASSSASGQKPTLENVAIGAGIGTVVGLITSYFTHKQVAEDRKDYEVQQFEMNFGDLPPSPFVVPKMTPKKGAK